ncbi:MAG: thermonuclease family protein [Actinomycetota bacterium]|nr:thermonuclease family protein [Actinomycetota bacterium]
MRTRLALLIVVFMTLAAALGVERSASDERSRAEGASVARVYDGDTLALSGGMRVRLVQIDTPEVGSGECYSRASARVLRRLAPPGTRVGLEADRRLDRVDRYGRLLRYVWRAGVNVNLELVRRGAATVWFYGGDRGKYASRLLAAARTARANRRGLWGACRAVWNPYGPAITSPRTRSNRPPSRCDPSYPDVCIPSPPPDLDCADVRYSGFRVVGADPHRFDGDHDGRGCEG